MGGLSLTIIGLLALVALVDYIPLLLNATKKPVAVPTSYGKIPDYLIMPTVYGNIAYLKNIKFLSKYADKVVICTSKYESEDFYMALHAACEKYGLRYVAVDVPVIKGQPVKNAYTIYKSAFKDLDVLGASQNTPCLLIDADTYAKDNVNNLIRTFIAEDCDMASLRCEVANVHNLIEVLQEYEYRSAMENRRMDPWLTSGACNMAKAGVFHEVFSNHSNFFAGGDIEIGKIAQLMGYDLRHVSFVFYTQVPSQFNDWFKQRIIWCAGGVRHHVVNLASGSWYHFFILLYSSLIIYLLLPLRWIEFIHFPLGFLALVCISWLYIFIVNVGRGWRKEYLALPAYAFIQSMIILPIAFVRYAKYAWSQKSLGIIRHDMSHEAGGLVITSWFLNIATAGVVLFIAVWLTVSRVLFWY